jgi:hypothetical protein
MVFLRFGNKSIKMPIFPFKRNQNILLRYDFHMKLKDYEFVFKKKRETREL